MSQRLPVGAHGGHIHIAPGRVLGDLVHEQVDLVLRVRRRVFDEFLNLVRREAGHRYSGGKTAGDVEI